MFQSKDSCYVTRNVDFTVPKKMQFFLWGLIDNQVKKGNEMDYFQKFELRVIDDIEYQTMLFPEDY